MKRSDRMLRGLLPIALLTGLLAGLAGPAALSGRAAPQALPVANAPVVISEFRTRGPGNPPGGPQADNNEFVEIFNRTGSTVDISGWGIEIVNASGTPTGQVTFDNTGDLLLGPGEHRLILNSIAPDPAPLTIDWNYTGSFTNDGAIALLDNNNQVVDSVALNIVAGFGEGNALAPMTDPGTPGYVADQSYERNNAGCDDSGDNTADFSLLSPSAPQASNSTPATCSFLTSTTTTITADTPDPSVAGVSYTVQYTVTGNPPSSLTPSGNVTVSDGASSCTGTAAAGQCALTSTGAGAKTLTATYTGDANFIESVSSAEPHTVTKMATTTTIVSHIPDPSAIGGSYVVSYTVAGAQSSSVTPTGNVTVSDGVSSCTGTVAAGQCPLTSTTAGTKNLVATFAGDGNFLGSVSATVTHTVSPAGATSTAAPVAFGVVINEVAWSGTRANADHEWIELYNRSGHDINLSGWWIQVTSADRQIPLSNKILRAGEFYLLERNEDATTVQSDQVNEWELLDDDSEILTLYAPGFRFIDQTFIIRGQWPAGTVTNTRSMERRTYTNLPGAVWVTYAGTHVATDPKDVNGNFINGTPGKANWNLAVTLTPSPTPTRVTTKVPTRTKPPQPRPVLNEFLPRSGFDWNQDGRVDVYDEFIEVANLGPAAWNTSGWRLDTGEDTEQFVLPALTINPGERALFYGQQSGLRLTDGGATVRLLNASGVIYDAQTYTVAKTPDKSWCRIKDLSGSWFSDCFPTPNFPNSREGEMPSLPPGTGLETPLCRLADTLPEEFILAECRAYGDDMWSSRYWDLLGWKGDRPVLQNGSKWESFVE